MSKAYFFSRAPHHGAPGGVTVCKKAMLPAGDFVITEYTWPSGTLWFVAADRFTANERQAAFRLYDSGKAVIRQLTDADVAALEANNG